MVPSRPSSYRECGVQIRALIDRFVEINARMGYSETDARGHALEECRAIGNSALMIVQVLRAGEERRADIGKLVGFVSGELRLVRVILDETARIYLVMLFQFKLETLWRNLLRELGVTDLRQGYYNMLSKLFANVPVADSDGSKFNALQVPALIRNSLHSNGYHYGYKGTSYHIEVDGLMYNFEEGAQVQCAGWYHIINALNRATSVVEEILSAPTIRALPDPVYNDFAPQDGA